MSASQIPNLLDSLSRGNGRGHSRGRGRDLRRPREPDLAIQDTIQGKLYGERLGSTGRGGREYPTFEGRGEVVRRKGGLRHIADSPDVSEPTTAERRDLAIQATDVDAAVSRYSAVMVGYLEDQFAQDFVEIGGMARRMPIINRGTYARTTAIDNLISSFLSSPNDPSTPIASEEQYFRSPTLESEHRAVTRQIISLGAGTDTRYFRLQAANKHLNLLYHEFDFPSVCEAKKSIVALNSRRAATSDQSPQTPTDEPTAWTISNPHTKGEYTCHSLDLRTLAETDSLKYFHGMRNDIPTLIISECCLCYFSIQEAESVLTWFEGKIPHLGVVLYEPVGADDAFGQMMIENLAARGLVMPTIQQYRTLEHQIQRLTDLGFREVNAQGGEETSGCCGSVVRAMTIQSIWEEWIDEHEKLRLAQLEGLDEIEEWVMLAQHYAVVWARRGDVDFLDL